MTPWEKAKQWWDKHSPQDFWEAVGQHLSIGYVWSSPECFMLARPARWNEEEQNFEDGPSNCWHVTLASNVSHDNPVAEFMRVLPHPYPWVSWFRGSRDNRIHVHKWDKVANKVRR